MLNNALHSSHNYSPIQRNTFEAENQQPVELDDNDEDDVVYNDNKLIPDSNNKGNNCDDDDDADDDDLLLLSDNDRKRLRALLSATIRPKFPLVFAFLNRINWHSRHQSIPGPGELRTSREVRKIYFRPGRGNSNRIVSRSLADLVENKHYFLSEENVEHYLRKKLFPATPTPVRITSSPLPLPPPASDVIRANIRATATSLSLQTKNKDDVRVGMCDELQVLGWRNACVQSSSTCNTIVLPDWTSDKAFRDHHHHGESHALGLNIDYFEEYDGMIAYICKHGVYPCTSTGKPTPTLTVTKRSRGIVDLVRGDTSRRSESMPSIAIHVHNTTADHNNVQTELDGGITIPECNSNDDTAEMMLLCDCDRRKLLALLSSREDVKFSLVYSILRLINWNSRNNIVCRDRDGDSESESSRIFKNIYFRPGRAARISQSSSSWSNLVENKDYFLYPEKVIEYLKTNYFPAVVFPAPASNASSIVIDNTETSASAICDINTNSNNILSRAPLTGNKAAVLDPKQQEIMLVTIIVRGSVGSIHVSINRLTPLAKVFDVYFLQFGIEQDKSRFLWNGESISGCNTPLMLGMGDREVLHCVCELE